MTEAKRYVVECYGGGESADRPALAVFDIDRTLAEWIIRMAQADASLRVYKIEDWNCTATWLEDDPRDDDDEQADTDIGSLSWSEAHVMRSDCDCIAVMGDTFLFNCCRRSGDDTFETAAQPIAALAAHFGIDFAAPRPPTGQPAVPCWL